MSSVTYHIHAKWKADEESPEVVGVRFLDTVDRLGPLDPTMSNWMLIDLVDYQGVFVADVRSRMTEYVEHNIRTDDRERPDPRLGYGLVAWGAEVASEFSTPETVHISVTGGSRWDNHVDFTIGSFTQPADAALSAYPIYKGALEVLASAWPCSWGYARAFVDDLPPLEAWDPNEDLANAPDEMGPMFEGAWIAYLSAPLVAGLTPPAQLLSERTPGGGLLISAVQDRLDPSNPDHMRRSRMLRAILQERVGEDQYAKKMPAYLPARVGPY